MTGIAPAPLWNRALHLARRSAARKALAAADAFVMGSKFIHDDYVRAGLLPAKTPAFVIPYGVEIAPRQRARPARRPLRFGVVGSILPHKGLHVAVGFSGHGFKLSPMIGRIVAQSALGKVPDLPLAPYSIERFATGHLLVGGYGAGVVS